MAATQSCKALALHQPQGAALEPQWAEATAAGLFSPLACCTTPAVPHQRNVMLFVSTLKFAAVISGHAYNALRQLQTAISPHSRHAGLLSSGGAKDADVVGAFGSTSAGLSLKAFLQWSQQLPALLVSLKSLLAAGTPDTSNAAYVSLTALSVWLDLHHACCPVAYVYCVPCMLH